MIEYKALGRVKLFGGLVQLTEQQLRRRAHAVASTDEAGIYQILNTVEFKAGEVFGHSHELPKTMNDIVEKVKGEPEPEPAVETVEPVKKVAKKKAAKKKASKKTAAKPAE